MSSDLPEKVAFGIGIAMGVVLSSAVLTPFAVLFNIISVEFATVLLTSGLVIVTSAYTLATYGMWFE